MQIEQASANIMRFKHHGSRSKSLRKSDMEKMINHYNVRPRAQPQQFGFALDCECI